MAGTVFLGALALSLVLRGKRREVAREARRVSSLVGRCVLSSVRASGGPQAGEGRDDFKGA